LSTLLVMTKGWLLRSMVASTQNPIVPARIFAGANF